MIKLSLVRFFIENIGDVVDMNDNLKWENWVDLILYRTWGGWLDTFCIFKGKLNLVWFLDCLYQHEGDG